MSNKKIIPLMTGNELTPSPPEKERNVPFLPRPGGYADDVAERIRQQMKDMSRQAIRDIPRETLEDNLERARRLAEVEKDRAQRAEERALQLERQLTVSISLLKQLVAGIRSTDLDVPGYEETLAFFVQEKMLKGGVTVFGDITVTRQVGTESIVFDTETVRKP